jgi:GDP/UDP-N,N'-diacetylbacillosamine 2-epimerase (hydrolysing)
MKLMFFTGARSEWGYIRPILELCKKKKIRYQLVVSNTHLLESFGNSKNEILNDGFKIHDEIYMTLDGYNEVTMSKSMALFGISFSDVLHKSKPDWLVLAGDRGETFMAGVMAAYMNIPIAHIQAGELSGNIDGQARHAIGKFTHLHFAANKDSEKRLIKLGEEKFRIHNVGAPQLDDMLHSKYLSLSKKKLLEKNFSIFNSEYALCIFHPVIEEYDSIKKNFNLFHEALKKSVKKRIWISPNSDAGSSIIKEEFDKIRDVSDIYFENLPRFEYLNLLKNCEFIIGNSSSGIIESATFKKACINVGRRQNKRLCSNNVVHVKQITEVNILNAIKKVKTKTFIKNLKKVKNPYGDGNASKKIIDILLNKKIKPNKLLKKTLTF